MKFKFAILCVLGLIAAAAAAILTASMQVQPAGEGQRGPREVTVVVAKENLPPLMRIEQEHVEMKQVVGIQAPRQYFSDPVEVIGQVLATSMVRGQAFTEAAFAPEGPGVHLASTLPHRMRAMTISVSDHAGMSGLLYPGSLVDVLASFRVQGGEGVLSMTLLRGVQVLALEDRTVVSPSQDGAASRRNDSRRRVTLMVDLKQAEALQLAMEHGNIGLAMRNPIDTADPDPDIDRLTSLSDLRSGTLWEAFRLIAEESAGPPTPEAPPQPPIAPEPEPEPEPKTIASVIKEPEVVVIPQWHTRILRAGRSTLESFAVDGEEEAR
jgi:pilus assembly protein CpaB